jgi:hypothetical protein
MSENDLLPYYKEILNSIPENIDFNFIPVKVVSSKQIILTNSSNTSIYFKITNAEGYIFRPNEGIIMRKKPITIEVLIEPISLIKEEILKSFLRFSLAEEGNISKHFKYKLSTLITKAGSYLHC